MADGCGALSPAHERIDTNNRPERVKGARYPERLVRGPRAGALARIRCPLFAAFSRLLPPNP